MKEAGYYQYALPMRGVVDVFARRVEVSWASNSTKNIHRRKKILLPPCALENGTASVIHAAVEDGAGGVSMSIDDLISMSQLIRFLFVTEVPDSCSSNRRKRVFTLV
eukprot:3900245-Pyramimonas_sp.AAC.1